MHVYVALIVYLTMFTIGKSQSSAVPACIRGKKNTHAHVDNNMD